MLNGGFALPDRGRLLVACKDQPGIVAAVSKFLFERGANIVQADQHTTDPTGGRFFMRVEFDLAGLDAGLPELEREFDCAVGQRFGMDWRVRLATKRKRLAIFVSREPHCLLELLWRQRAGDVPAEIALVISNHASMEEVARASNAPFHHVPVTAATKDDAEREQQRLLDEHQADTLVLARYMQVLSGEFVQRWAGRAINIHHSFLPAFAGASPYEQAYTRGVKLIGATAHYVTDELDAGPIIEQDVQRVDHRYGPDDLRRIGRLVERTVLARAVGWHVDDRVLVYDNKTVVFA
jgi:formyltetrahydrofolate deformylase